TDAAAIQTALNGLSTIAGIGASVTVAAAGGGVFNVTFAGSLGGMDIPILNADITSGPGTITRGSTAGTTPIGFKVPDELLTLTGAGFNGAAFDNIAGHNAWETVITLVGGISMRVAANTNFTADGSIDGGILTKIGLGRLILPTANTFDPGVLLNQGIIN